MSPLFLVALYIATVIAALLAFQGGLRLGRWRTCQPDPEPVLPARTLVASILSLLAFILGFTFGFAESHVLSRNQSVSDEVIAIGTPYRRASFLPDPERKQMRHLLREYVDLRLEMAGSAGGADALPRLRQLQERIWSQNGAIGNKDIGQTSDSPLTQSLIEVFDIHGERVLTGFRSRIPLRIWLFLYGITAVSVAAAGYHAGLGGARTSIAAVAYALVFAAVIVIIAAGDNPGATQFQNGRQAFTSLRARLTEP
jgi:hypothetical protein